LGKKNGLKCKEEKPKSRRRKTLHYGSVPVYILQQLKAKMPAAGATQALRLFNSPLCKIIPAASKIKKEKASQKELYAIISRI
jgi:hypothetical protein